MPKFRVYGTVTGGAFLGEIEAENAEAAQAAAEEAHLDTTIGLCHQCAHEISDPTVSAVAVEPAD